MTCICPFQAILKVADCYCNLQTALQYSSELVCLAMDYNAVAAGSQSHVTLVDSRKRGAVQYIASLEPNSVRLDVPDD